MHHPSGCRRLLARRAAARLRGCAISVLAIIHQMQAAPNSSGNPSRAWLYLDGYQAIIKLGIFILDFKRIFHLRRLKMLLNIDWFF